MIVAGIDVGGKNIHAVIMDNGGIVAREKGPAGINKADNVEGVFGQLLESAGMTRDKIERVVTTGSAGKRIAFKHGFIPDAGADARGVIKFFPNARTVIDVGAEEGRAIKIDSAGKVLDYAMNEKCAAGTGTFVEAMARALEIDVEEMAKISQESEKSTPMNAQCAVFGESEVVSLIHQKIPKKDIARAVHDAIAGRVGSVARIVGLEKDIVMVGGMAHNAGFVESLKREIDMDVTTPDDPSFIGAIGAAIAASEGVTEEEVTAKVFEKDTIEKQTA